ncbi:MAG: transposase [Actinobacteria bacterium]|nr:transposase [Actinomycetota bacterium]
MGCENHWFLLLLGSLARLCEHAYDARTPTQHQAPTPTPTLCKTPADSVFATRAEARRKIFTWINWYNSKRLHSSLDHTPATRWEQQSRPPDGEMPIRLTTNGS